MEQDNINYKLIKAGGKKGEAEMNRLLKKHEGYITQFAKSYLGRACNDGNAITFDDLKSTAKLGMMASVHKYDPAKGNFLSWATNYMKSAIYECCGLSYQKNYYDEYEDTYDDSNENECENCGLGEDRYKNVDFEPEDEEVAIGHTRYEVNAGYEGNELVPISDDSAEDSVNYKEAMAIVRNALNDEEFKIFCRYRGLAGYKSTTMPVIAKDMGISLLHAQSAYLHSLVELGIDDD